MTVGGHLSNNKRRLKKEVASQLRSIESELRSWDPLGVGPGHHAPADEYDSYAPAIVSLIRRGATVDELASYLVGLKPVEAEKQSLECREVAARMIERLREL